MNKELVEELYAARNAVREILSEYEKDWDLVDDLMHDVYAEALESEYNEKSEPLTWLCAIAKNVGRMHVRSQHAEKRANEVLEVYVETNEQTAGTPYYDRADLSMDLAAEQDALDPALLIEAEDSIEHALDTMPHRVACVVRLRAKGYTNQQVAEHLGIAEKTVRNLMTESHQYFRDNQEFNATNSIRSEREVVPLERYSSQQDLERAVQARFEKRSAAFEKRRIRMRTPEATLSQWKDAYECLTD